MTDKDLVEFLESQLTEKRRSLFHKVIEYRTRHFAVAVENIYQPHNASAVLRSCECFGIQDVHIIEKDHTYAVSKGVVKGADKWLDLHYHRGGENPTLSCIRGLKDKGYKIIAATPHQHSCTLETYDISSPSVFFFGEELRGLSQDVLLHADGYMMIPMVGLTESFNISVAVAITLHHLTYTLRKSNIHWQLSEDEQLALRLSWAMKSLPRGERHVKYFYQNKRKILKEKYAQIR